MAPMINEAMLMAYMATMRGKPMLTNDLSDGFFSNLVTIAEDVEASPVDIMCVMQSESGISAKAHNPAGDASGVIQFMPQTLMGLGWHKGHAAFRELTAEAQLPYVKMYFAPHKGLIGSLGRVYGAVFLPALLPSIKSPSTVLCGLRGPLSWAYSANTGFDVLKTGTITVKMLEDAVARQCHGPRWEEAQDRLRDAMAPKTIPVASEFEPDDPADGGICG